MWQKLLDAIANIATLTRDTKENRDDIKKLRSDFEKMTLLMERVLNKLEQVETGDRHEREKLALKLENELLRFKDQMRDVTAAKALPPKNDEQNE